jgi:DNA replication protein DnaC
MLINPTIDKLNELGLKGMAAALEEQLKLPDVATLSFEDRLGMLIDHEQTSRANVLLKSRLKTAKLRQTACMEDINFRQARGLDKAAIKQLASCQWIDEHLNVLITGKTGVGKTYLACALAHKACQQGFRVLYVRAPRLIDDLALARAKGTYNTALSALAKKDVLVLDDFGLVALSDDMARDLLEVIDDRSGVRSTVIASQLPLESWHQTITNATFADAIIDRVVHSAYKVKLKGETMRDPKNQTEQ